MLDKFCSPQKNILYERYGFWTLQQDEDELIDAYLRRLKLKIYDCEYNKDGWLPAVKAELTRDKFIFGLQDDSLKEHLLRESDLTLPRAVSIAQRSESSKKHVKEMSNSSSNLSVNCDEVHRGPPLGATGKSKPFSCGQCGRTHKPKEYPTYGQQCSICHKCNHFAKVCRSKHLFPRNPQPCTMRNVHVVNEYDVNSDSESTLSLDPIQIDGLAEDLQCLLPVVR